MWSDFLYLVAMAGVEPDTITFYQTLSNKILLVSISYEN